MANFTEYLSKRINDKSIENLLELPSHEVHFFLTNQT